MRLREEFGLYASTRPARTLVPGGRYEDIDHPRLHHGRDWAALPLAIPVERGHDVGPLLTVPLYEPGRVLLLTAQIQEMRHALAVRDEPVGDIGAVTVRRVAFGAHDADGAVDRRQGAGGDLKLVGLHVVGVRGPHAAERPALPEIGDAGFFDRGREIRSVELGMATGSGIGTHVDERADAGFLKDRYEFAGAARAVAEREDQAATSTALERKNEGRYFGDPHSVEPAGVDLRSALYDLRMEDRRAQHRLDVHPRWSVDSNPWRRNP